MNSCSTHTKNVNFSVLTVHTSGHLTETRCKGMDRIDLAQVTNKWWALENMGMNLWVPSNVWNILTC